MKESHAPPVATIGGALNPKGPKSFRVRRLAVTPIRPRQIGERVVIEAVKITGQAQSFQSVTEDAAWLTIRRDVHVLSVTSEQV